MTQNKKDSTELKDIKFIFILFIDWTVIKSLLNDKAHI